MKKIFFTLLVFGCLSTSVTYSQSKKHVYILEYSVGLGTDFIDNASFRGIGFEYRNMIKPNIGVGVGFGYNFFYEERDYETYTDGSQSFSGKQFRYLHNIPMIVAGDYYFKPNEKINPFVGFGIGGNYIFKRTEMGVFLIDDEAFQFAMRPEVGAIFQAGPNANISFTAKYLIGTDADDIDAVNYFALNLGFVF
ncbi:MULTISPECIES: outer membrane beta-barrel protein [Flavobacterium]|uniref:outer membrane beta-barrel protein n=1 Tax=Flavobacterium TaxID=237 RepID=UPI001FCC17DE|nr:MULTISPECIES: OmpW family outer membrane protein [Flavobacterium]UOK41549.1 porin family protein [Flavobacterium enshiense]